MLLRQSDAGLATYPFTITLEMGLTGAVLCATSAFTILGPYVVRKLLLGKI